MFNVSVNIDPDLVATEFIKMISMQSNEICEKDKKKTIAPEHAIQAISVSYCKMENIRYCADLTTDHDAAIDTRLGTTREGSEGYMGKQPRSHKSMYFPYRQWYDRV